MGPLWPEGCCSSALSALPATLVPRPRRPLWQPGSRTRPTRYEGLSLPVLVGCGGARRLPAGPLALPGLLWSAVVFHLSLVGLPCVQVSKSWEVLATSLHHGAGRVPASWPGVCPPSAPGA